MPPLENPIRGEGTEAAEDCLEAAADIDADPSFATKLEADRDGAPEVLDVLEIGRAHV